jgi:hypothetical protein
MMRRMSHSRELADVPAKLSVPVVARLTPCLRRMIVPIFLSRSAAFRLFVANNAVSHSACSQSLFDLRALEKLRFAPSAADLWSILSMDNRAGAPSHRPLLKILRRDITSQRRNPPSRGLVVAACGVGETARLAARPCWHECRRIVRRRSESDGFKTRSSSHAVRNNPCYFLPGIDPKEALC